MRNLLVVVVSIIIASCASVDKVKSMSLSSQEGLTVNSEFEPTIEQVKRIAIRRGLTIEESYREGPATHILILSAPVAGVGDGLMSGISYGEWLKVGIFNKGEGATRVVIGTQKKASFNLVGSQRHSEAIFSELKLEDF